MMDIFTTTEASYNLSEDQLLGEETSQGSGRDIVHEVDQAIGLFPYPLYFNPTPRCVFIYTRGCPPAYNFL